MTDRFAIFGRPLDHSKSPQIYQTFARQFGIDLDYQKIETSDQGFAAAFGTFCKSGVKGGNVTAPFKVMAYEAAARKMPRAAAAGAVNCYKVKDGEVVVENFDGLGLVADIERNLGFPLAGKDVLLLGAGGAARGAILPFLDSRPSSLVLTNRTPAKAHALAARFSPHGAIEVRDYDALADVSFDIVVNATSASLSGKCPAVPDTVFRRGGLAYELFYGEGLTPFLTLASRSGAKLAHGVGMLVEQAAEAFNWWYGKRPDTKDMIQMLSVPLSAQPR